MLDVNALYPPSGARKSPEFAPLLVVFFLLVPVLGAPLAAVSPFTPAIAYFHRRSVRRAWSLLTFYATNFIAHAFSVPLTVEVESPHQHQRIFSPIPWAACISIFLPFHGLGRDILLIAQQWDLDSLRTAAVHGALVVVARNKKWRPQEDEEDEVFVKLPEEFDGCSHQAKDNPPAEFQLTEERHILVPEKKQHTVLGELKPPAGYSLVIPTDRAIIEQIMDSAIISTKGIKVHSPPNILKILAAIFQIVSASLVLAFTLGDQVSRFGYAAYGLSVVPYALMSGANVICCAVVGEYNTRHVLRTPILEEAAKRKLAIFDGAVGRLGESEDVRKSKDEAQNSPKDFTPVHLRLTKSEEQVVLAVRKGEIVKNFFLIPEKTDATTSQVTAGVILEETNGEHKSTCASSIVFGISPITHCGLQQTTKRFPINALIRTVVVSVCLGTAMFLPYAIMYALTHFKNGQSTIAERVLMLAWLVADQISGSSIIFFWFVWKTSEWSGPKWLTNSLWRKKAFDWSMRWLPPVTLTVLTLPAIGGFIMVGRMFLEDDGSTPAE